MSNKKHPLWEPTAIEQDNRCICCYRVPEWQDDTGLRWCEIHQDRGLLMDVGLIFNWPSVTCPPYAIQAGYETWNLIAGIGKDEYIEALLVAVGAREEEVAA